MKISFKPDALSSNMHFLIKFSCVTTNVMVEWILIVPVCNFNHLIFWWNEYLRCIHIISRVRWLRTIYCCIGISFEFSFRIFLCYENKSFIRYCISFAVTSFMFFFSFLFSLKALKWLSRLLMEKEAASIAESCYLHIKHIGKSSWDTCQVAMLGGLIKL